ncbi:16S rRNA (cytosine(1402)-N(4))-methyltransferase RsmH [bacterium]|nr:16S rRNA (cytosine(1402)-N(4))-methyltransferase RsmH [bacterium]
MAWHRPVLVKEVLKFWVNPKFLSCPRIVVVDATCGEGGHSLALLKKAKKEGWLFKLHLVALDRDPEILNEAKKNLNSFRRQVNFVNANFSELDKVFEELKLKHHSGILFDLGPSTFHFKKANRGFGLSDSTLRMTYEPSAQRNASRVIHEFSEEKLAEIIKRYGEERWAKRIAKAIVEARKKQKITSAKQLAEIVASAIPRKFWPPHIHPATRTFMALRIFVNQELLHLKKGLKKALKLAEKGARLAVISFHSLEDRVVKHFFKRYASPCRDEIYGVEIEEPHLKILTPKPISPGEEEVRKNPSARSAKLRVAEKR